MADGSGIAPERSSNARRVGFYANYPPNFTELLPLADLLKGQGDEVYFLLDFGGFPLGDAPARCEERGIPWRNLADQPDLTPEEITPLVEMSGQILSKVVSNAQQQRIDTPAFDGFMSEFPRQFVIYGSLRARARSLIKELAPDLMICCEDTHLGYEVSILKACQEERIPTLCYGINCSRTYVALSRLVNPDYGWKFSLHDRFNRFISQAFANTTLAYQSTKMLAESAAAVVAASTLQVFPPCIYATGGGFTDTVATLGTGYKDHYLQEGCPGPGRFVLTGKLHGDDLWRHRAARQGNPAGGRTVFISVPPLHYVLPEATLNLGFESRRAFIEALIRGILVIPETRVILSLHPRVDVKDYLDLDDGERVCLDDRPVTAAIAEADICIAPFSTINLMGLSLGIPCIDPNVNGFSFTMFDDPGIRHLDDFDDLSQSVKALLTDDAVYARESARAAASADRWYPMDGLNGERLLSHIDSVVAARLEGVR